MSETLENSQETAATEGDLQPDVQPAASATEPASPSAPVCKCGQPQDPSNPKVCLWQHQWKGGEGSGIRAQEPVPVVDAATFDADAVLARGLRALDKAITRKSTYLERAALTPSQLDVESKRLADLVARVLPMRRELNAVGDRSKNVTVTFGGRYKPEDTQQRAGLLDCLPELVLRFLVDNYESNESGWREMEDAQFFAWLDDVAAKDTKIAALVAVLQGQSLDGLPLPLTIELSEQLGPQRPPETAPVSDPNRSKPDAITRRYLSAEELAKVDGAGDIHISQPLKVVARRTPVVAPAGDEPRPYQLLHDGTKYYLAPGEKAVITRGPVYGSSPTNPVEFEPLGDPSDGGASGSGGGLLSA